MTIAVFSEPGQAGRPRLRGWAVRRRHRPGHRLGPAQPLNGQRCLTRAAFEAALPLARGWGVETGLTIDLLRQGLRVVEVEVPMAHRPTGNDWLAQVHRARQFAWVAWALAVREPAVQSAAQASKQAQRRIAHGR